MTDFCSKTPQEQQAYFQAMRSLVNQSDGYARHSHVTITHMEPGGAEGVLDLAPEVLNPMGIVHGGCLATLADTVTGAAAHSTGLKCVTLNCTMNYLRPAVGRQIFCKAKVQKSGRTIQVCEAVLTNDQGEAVATGTFTFCAIGVAEPQPT